MIGFVWIDGNIAAQICKATKDRQLASQNGSFLFIARNQSRALVSSTTPLRKVSLTDKIKSHRNNLERIMVKKPDARYTFVMYSMSVRTPLPRSPYKILRLSDTYVQNIAFQCMQTKKPCAHTDKAWLVLLIGGEGSGRSSFLHTLKEDGINPWDPSSTWVLSNPYMFLPFLPEYSLAIKDPCIGYMVTYYLLSHNFVKEQLINNIII